MKCLPACGNCHGMSCSNNGAGSQATDDMNNSSDDESGIMDHDSETEND